jgi:hypothetical protein
MQAEALRVGSFEQGPFKYSLLFIRYLSVSGDQLSAATHIKVQNDLSLILHVSTDCACKNHDRCRY